MKRKGWIFIALLIMVLHGFVYGQLKRDYTFQFPGWKFIKPTQICSLMDQIILLQNAQAKLKQGIAPKAIPFFEGEIPSPQLKKISGNSKPVDVAKIMIEAIQLFASKEKIQQPIPPMPDRKIFPADVLVYTSIAFDLLLEHLEEKGVGRIGDYSLLRYRYPTRLKPKD